ncbi:uncharacterized protein LOC110976247 [Acanthaster planci]|uniref:Uncharacterized protein LOC110976247 n=1 Tax=Acanthaster planci TaxID=133434 RepID=A0A8B7XYD7_ACAPL|nr:uncharacterized protein LOC110976247 [Acanthaster planci]
MNLTRLLTLNLLWNQISTIEPGCFSGLSRLLRLNLGFNQLEKLDADIIFGVGRELWFEMRVDHNRLKILDPLTFSGISYPGRINCDGNRLLEIPSRLMYQKHKESTVNILIFTNNQIERLAPDAFEGLKYIHMLYFSSNRIKALPDSIFINTTIGNTLDLSSNMIRCLPDGLFRSMSKLRYLYMGNNMLTVLSKKMFDGLRSLRELLISDNPIIHIDDRVFSETQLVNLYIYNTQLKSISDRPFVTRNSTIMLVSLYGSNIEAISDSVWQDLGLNSRIFIENTLRRVHQARSDVEIGLVGSGFVQPINVSSQSRKALITSGFHCGKVYGERWQCTPCPQGTYGGPWGSCRACPFGGFFQNRTGQVLKTGADMNCLSCNNGTYVTPAACPGRSIGDCVVCPSGTDKSRHAGFRACPCASNYYRRDRFGECFSCPLEGINCSGEYQHLVPGFWWTWDWGSTDNYQSYENYVKNILVKNDSYDKHACKFQGVLPKVHSCPRRASCQNLVEGLNATCQHGYSDFLCSKCIPKFYSWFGQCFKCPNWRVFLLEILASVLAIVVAICIVAWDLRRHRRRGRSVVSVLFSRLKILLGFYQIMGEIFDAVHDLPWPQPLIKIGSFFRVLEVNIMQLIVSPRCYFPNFTYPTVYIEFIAGLSFSILVIISALSLYKLIWLYLRLKETPADVCSDVLTKTKQTCYLVVVILLFIAYPSLSHAILTLLPSGCDEFDLDETEKIKVRRLRSDFSIDCKTYEHGMYITAAEASLCYVVGFPLVLLFMLWIIRRRRKKPSNSSSISDSRDDLGQTPLDVADRQTGHDTHRHELEDIPQGRIEDSANLVSHDNMNNMIDTAPNIGQLASPSFLALNRKITWETFLCENYKEQFWYWEIVELARKILQVLFVLLFGAEDHFTLFATIVLSVGFLVVHAYVKPMKDAAEHRLQMCSLASIFLNLLVASLLLLPSDGSGPSEARKKVLAVFLVLLNLSIVAFVAGSAIWSFAKLVFKTACCRRATMFVAHVCRKLLPLRRYWVSRRRPGSETQVLLSGRPVNGQSNQRGLSEARVV